MSNIKHICDQSQGKISELLNIVKKEHLENKKILYIDMDGVLVDIKYNIDRLTEDQLKKYEGRIDNIPDLFKDPPVMEGAVAAFKKLSLYYEVFILTTSPWDNPPTLMHKRLWLEKHLGNYARKKMITSHRKDLLMGDYLIDDRLVNGASDFIGEHLHFGQDKFPDWNTVLKYLLPVK